MHDYGYVIIASWAALIAVWVVGAFTAKGDVSSGSRVFRMLWRWLWQLFLVGLLIFALTRNLPGDVYGLEFAFFHLGPAVGWAGAFLTVVGIVLAIWARCRLGRNWGSRPKEDHQLVTTGPYGYVRHPIYSGAILALFGSALTGSVVAFALFVISIIFCLRRISREESTMLAVFPGQYPSYQARTKRLTPFVW